MFKRSTIFVLLIVAMVFISSFAANMIATASLPSSYDPGISINDAFQHAKTPLVIEFYSDSCGTCQHVSPIVHDLIQGKMKNQLTLVMLDVDAPENMEVAKIFGVDELPSIYLFDLKRMKKQKIGPESFPTEATMRQSLELAMANNEKLPIRNPMGMMGAGMGRSGMPQQGMPSQPPPNSQAFESRNHGAKQ